MTADDYAKWFVILLLLFAGAILTDSVRLGMGIWFTAAAACELNNWKEKREHEHD